MRTIKTHLKTRLTDDNGEIEVQGQDAFSGVYALGLIMGSATKKGYVIPVDDDQLGYLHESLNMVVQDCLSGLAGLGGLIQHVKAEGLIESDLVGYGIAVANMAKLAEETMNYMQDVEADIRVRAQHREVS